MSDDQHTNERKLLDAYISEGFDRVDDYRRPDLLEMAHKNQALSLEHGLAFAREQHALNWETPVWPIILGGGEVSTINYIGTLTPSSDPATNTVWADASDHTAVFGKDGYQDDFNIAIARMHLRTQVGVGVNGTFTETYYLTIIDALENPLLQYQVDMTCVAFAFTSVLTVPMGSTPSFNGVRATCASGNQQTGTLFFFDFEYVLGPINAVTL